MRLPVLGAKYQTNFIQVKNGEVSATLPNGTPVALAFNGTDDGLAVVLPSTAAQAKVNTLMIGVVENSTITAGISAGSVGDVLAFGMCTNAIIALVTRSATTAVWPSYPALSIGQQLGIDTVNNAFKTVQSVYTVVTNATTDTLALTIAGGNYFGIIAACGQTLASTTTQATTTANALTVSTAAVKVFIRAM